MVVSTAGAVVQDTRFTDGANVIVQAPGVTVRRVEFVGGGVLHTNQSSCFGGSPAVVEDSTFLPPAGKPFGPNSLTLSDANMVVRRVEVYRRAMGVFLSDCSRPDVVGQLPVSVENSFFYMDGGEWPNCLGSQQQWYPGTSDNWHFEAMQAFNGRGGTFVNNTLVFATLCGTSPLYFGHGSSDPNRPTMNKGEYNIDRMLVAGAAIRSVTRSAGP